MSRRRRNKEEEHENLERWLVSYADFITLLFAFFVVMYALSTVSEGKYRVLSDSLVSAFRSRFVEPAIPPAQPFSGGMHLRKIARPGETRREQMRGIAQDILRVLGTLVRDGQVKVSQSNRGISVEINASVLFASGQAHLRPDSGRTLREVATVIAATGHPIEVEGYADNAPISTAQFPSNWELSAARASSVVRLFIDGGVAEQRLRVIGYGPNRPVAANDTPEGRARNRRVAVMILAETPDKVIEIPLTGEDRPRQAGSAAATGGGMIVPPEN